jgi:hypothetical protein
MDKNPRYMARDFILGITRETDLATSRRLFERGRVRFGERQA